VKEAAVILLGRTVRLLDSTNYRTPGIVARLTDSLKTPSEQVQVAVPECIAPLARLLRKSTPGGGFARIISCVQVRRMERGSLWSCQYYTMTGISSIKVFDVIERLRSAMEDKKAFEPCQGAIFAIGTMSATFPVTVSNASFHRY